MIDALSALLYCLAITSYWLRAQRLFSECNCTEIARTEMSLFGATCNCSDWECTTCNCICPRRIHRTARYCMVLFCIGPGRAWWACCTKSTKLKGFESRAVPRPLLNHACSSGSLCAFHSTFGDHCGLKREFGGDCTFKHQHLREVSWYKIPLKMFENFIKLIQLPIFLLSLSQNIFSVKLFSDHFLFNRGSI